MEEVNIKEKDLNEMLRNSLIQDLSYCFVGLNDDERELLALRMIIDLSENNFFVNEIFKSYSSLSEADKIFATIKASNSNIGLFKPLAASVMVDQNNRFQDIYKESLNHYKKVLDNYSNLAKELSLDSSLEISHLFSYMLWNGFYSSTKEHAYRTKDRMLIPGLFSFDVIKGGGVCLAYSDLLYNYLLSCGKKAALLDCEVPTRKNSIKCDYKPRIERKVDIKLRSKALEFLASPAVKFIGHKFGNHAVNLIEEKDSLYIYDSTNLYVLNIIDAGKAEVINGKGSFFIKPLSTLMIQPGADKMKLFEKLVSGDIGIPLKRKDVVVSFENVIDLAIDNRSLLDDAYSNIYSDLEFIDCQTKLLEGKKIVQKIKKKQREYERNFK